MTILLLFCTLAYVAVYGCILINISITLGARSFADWASMSVLPDVEGNVCTAYNNNSYYIDCIWVFGGNSDDNIIYCFNLTNSQIQYWDILQRSSPSGFIQTDGTTDILYYHSSWLIICIQFKQQKS